MLLHPPTSEKPGAPQKRAAVAAAVGELDPLGVDGLGVALRAFAALGVEARAVQTALRTRVAHALDRIELMSETVAAQLAATSQGELDAAWLSPIGSEGTMRVLAESLASERGQDGYGKAPAVLDLRIVDRGGDTLLAANAIEALRSAVLPHASLAVANLDEVEVLCGRTTHGELSAMKDAARRIADLGASNVLITGGRSDGHAIDIFYDRTGFLEFGCDRVRLEDPRALYGAGATLTSSITALLARDRSLPEAIDVSKRVVERAIKDAAPGPRGVGRVCDPMAPRYRALNVEMQPRTVSAVVSPR